MGSAAGSQRYQVPHTQSRRCLAKVGPEYAGPVLLSADVGGTSSRLHLFLAPQGKSTDAELLVTPDRLIAEYKYTNSKYETFEDLLKSFLKEAGLAAPPLLACLAVAGVVVDNRCKFVNLGWTIDGTKLEQELKIKRVVLINDFAAQGYGLLTLNPKQDCDVLQAGVAKEGAPIAVLGAGTGLGEAFLTTGNNGDYEVWPSEGGHSEFAPRQEGSSNLQFEMIQYMQIKFSAKARVSVERVVAGRGIANIYEFLAWKFPEKVNRDVHRNFIGPVEGPRNFDPSVITEAATKGLCELSRMTVELWCGAYGAEAGSVALTYMPYGGLYITGGVTNKLRDWLLGKKTKHNSFMESFLDKGRVSPMLKRIPVFIVRGEDMGERGAMLKASRLYLEASQQRKRSKGQMCDHDSSETRLLR